MNVNRQLENLQTFLPCIFLGHSSRFSSKNWLCLRNSADGGPAVTVAAFQELADNLVDAVKEEAVYVVMDVAMVPADALLE